MKNSTMLLIIIVIAVFDHACSKANESYSNNSAPQEQSEIVLDAPPTELCRVVVNYKNNHHLYVEFGKNGFKPIDAAGTLVKLDDEWGVISIARFQFDDQRITSNEFILRMINSSSDMLYQIYRPLKERDGLYYGYRASDFYCLPFAYHELFDGLIINSPRYIEDISKIVFDDESVTTYAKSIFDKFHPDSKSRKVKICEQNSLWFIYKNKPFYSYVCEPTLFERTLDVYETFDNFVSIHINTKSTTCRENSSDEYLSSIRIQSNPDKKVHFPLDSFVQTYLPESLYDNYRNTHGNSAPLSLVLFTEGKRQRRSFGVPLDWKDGKITQIAELSETPERLEDILRSIDKAPNGCGSFDWETAELVHKDGKRYSLGAFDSIAGIYWLSPDDTVDTTMLSSDIEPLVFNDYEYEPPQPMPNCEYFSEAHQAKIKYDKQARECGCFLSFRGSYNPSPKCHSEHYDYFYEHYEDFVDEIEEAEGPNEDLDCGGGS